MPPQVLKNMSQEELEKHLNNLAEHTRALELAIDKLIVKCELRRIKHYADLQAIKIK